LSTEEEEFVLKEFVNIIDYSIKWHKQQKKITKNTKSKVVDTSFTEKAFVLDDVYDAIIALLLIYPAINVKQLCNLVRLTGSENQYRKMRRMVNKLVSLGLIEKAMTDSVHIGNMDKVTVPYRLTLVGIIYVITNHKLEIFALTDPLIRIMSEEYYFNNILYRLFLYPYFMPQTVAIKELRFELLNYLNKICDRIKERLDHYYMWYKPESSPHSLIEGKYLLKQLFIWDRTEEGKDDTKRSITDTLKNYLYEELQWTWIQDANFSLNYENNLIEIIGRNNEYSRIQISPSRQTVILKYDGNTFENILKMFPMKDHFIILGKSGTIKEEFDPGLWLDCQKELLTLLFTIQYHYATNDKINQILSMDTKYQAAIMTMINILDINSNRFPIND
jgi:hypothetical protein